MQVQRDGHERHEQRHQPDAGDAERHHAARHQAAVAQRVLDVDVAVQRDGAQVQDAGRAAEHVKRDPHVAELGAERPVLEQVVGERERHDGAGQRHVGHAQRYDVQVADLAQVAVGEHGHADEHVARHGHDDDDGEEGAHEDLRGQPERAGLRRRLRRRLGGADVQ